MRAERVEGPERVIQGRGEFADARALLAALRRDKKTRGATLRLVVLDGLAAPTRLEGPPEDLLREAYAALA